MLLMVCLLAAMDALAQITKPNPLLVYDTRYVLPDLVYRRIDTSLENFHHYNPTWNWEVPYLQLSNIAQPPRQLMFAPLMSIGYRPGWDVFSRYFYVPDSTRFYNTKTPFTSARYDIGAKEEQLLHVIHSQNINPQLNLAIDYKRMVGDGFFTNNKAGTHNFIFSQWYRSKKNRYNLMTSYILNQVKNQENGGINAEDPFSNPSFQLNQKLIPVNLEDAQNRQDRHQLNIRQHFYFGKSVDTVKVNDTTAYAALRPQWALVHEFRFTGEKFRFNDNENDSSFFENFYFFADSSRDYSRSRSIGNEFLLESYTPEPGDSAFDAGKKVWSAGLNYTLHHYKNPGNDAFLHSIQLKGKLASNPYNEGVWKYNLEGAVDLAPMYFGDFIGKFQAKFSLDTRFSVAAGASANLQSPGYRYEHWQSNHFLWNNDLKRIFVAAANGTFQWNPWNISVSGRYFYVQNYLYINENIQPQQLDKTLQVMQGEISKTFDWKRFYMQTRVMAQWNNRNDVLRQASVWLKHRMYYKGSYVKKRPIHAQLGMDITYFNSHQSLGYMPGANEFYTINADKLTYFPVVDVFFNLQVKRTRLFFMAQYVNAGLIWDGYYAAENYLMPGRIIRGGVSWQFYD